MNNYVEMIKSKDSIQVCFYNDNDKIRGIGEKMEAINEEAYMNGYSWDIFFNYYLEKNSPNILEEMDTDPEAGMYVPCYSLTVKNELKAKKFVEIIRSLIENEEEIYRIIHEESDEIEWD